LSGIFDKEQKQSMTYIKIREGDSVEYALKRFKKNCEKEGIQTEFKKREFYEKPSVRRKKKKLNAIKRILKKVRKHNFPN
jgi:small subunit ribosomal protein S21